MIKKISYWLTLLSLVAAIFTVQSFGWAAIDNFVYSESQGEKLENKVDSYYDNTNGRLLYLEKKSAENEAIATQKSRDDAAYREKMQDSMGKVLQSLVRLETQANIQNNRVNRNDP